LNKEQVVLLKNYLKIADASDVELAGCLEVSRRYRLDPFKQGQIWFVKRWDKNAVALSGSKGAFVYTPQVGIYGMLHIAARDHSDYGSLSEAEFGPMFMHDVEGHKFKAPEWCRVKAFKKGIAEPTVAAIYFEEFCPALWDNARLFWSRMPRAQIEKCAKARVVRTAYPDLGGLYIPEEMDRMNDNLTPSGRQVTFQEDKPTVTLEAQAAIDGLKARGLWCDEHNCIRNGKHLETCGSSRNASKPPAAPKAAPSQPQAQDPLSWKKETEKKANDAAKPSAKKPDPKQGGSAADVPKAATAPATSLPPAKYELTIDWTLDRKLPLLTGDVKVLADILVAFTDFGLEWGKDGFWHAEEKNIPRIMELASSNGFLVKEIQPNASGQVPPSGQRNSPPPVKEAAGGGRGRESAGASPSVVSGTIEKSIAGMVGTTPVRDVTLLLADKSKPTYRCWDKKWFEHLDAGVGKKAELVLKQNKQYLNVIGARKIGSKEWLDDGTPAIQNKDREAGGKTLFG
jgi:RecT family